jgi:uncharacterized protein HemY
MQQITFTITNAQMAKQILSSLNEWDTISNLQITSLDAEEAAAIIPEKKLATSVNDLLTDWTDMKESTETFRKKLWKKMPSY